MVDPATNRTALNDSCYLLKATDARQITRFVLEIITEIIALIYIVVALVQIHSEVRLILFCAFFDFQFKLLSQRCRSRSQRRYGNAVRRLSKARVKDSIGVSL